MSLPQIADGQTAENYGNSENSHAWFSPDVIICGWLGLKHQLTN